MIVAIRLFMIYNKENEIYTGGACMGREFELKFAATEAVQAEIQAAYGPWTKIAMETTYFDTADGALSARRMTLRLRKENQRCVCTLKTPLPDGSRGEWECDAEDIHQGIRNLLTLGAPQLLAELTAQGVQPSCGAKFIRHVAQIPTADGVAELALDKGVLLGGGRQQPLCEIEVELKEGSEKATVLFAFQLATQYSLEGEPDSKFRRAMALAQGE
jgi:inorganic triphosphatase YgiF